MILLLMAHQGNTQVAAPVKWQFRINSTASNQATLLIQASIAPGWHLYSQFIEEGGPIPTEIVIDPTYAVAIGKAEERGERITFRDELYEMDITWYAGDVGFAQKIKLLNGATSVCGVIEYQVCDDQVCVPSTKSFELKLQ